MQYEPYNAITEVVKNQIIFNLNGVEGTVVGFFFPDCLNGVDSVDYHLHFIANDHTGGGHLLECSVESAKVEIDSIDNYHLLIL